MMHHTSNNDNNQKEEEEDFKMWGDAMGNDAKENGNVIWMIVSRWIFDGTYGHSTPNETKMKKNINSNNNKTE